MKQPATVGSDPLGAPAMSSQPKATARNDQADPRPPGRVEMPCDVSPMPFHRYRPYRPFTLPARACPDRELTRAPQWASVDLRDGNQALVDPMDPERNLKLCQTRGDIGFKEL